MDIYQIKISKLLPREPGDSYPRTEDVYVQQVENLDVAKLALFINGADSKQA